MDFEDRGDQGYSQARRRGVTQYEFGMGRGRVTVRLV